MVEKVTIKLTKDEALVIFDFLGRFNENSTEKDFEHRADQIALWNLEVVLESVLAEPFLPNYEDLIKEAREKMLGGK